ncbi:phosphate ABC transporter substrate-binding protein PstS family protein [Halobacillus sp. A5]|uniref:phosphate ABC transporter substrate-binding protein PstS family protein n=1 Tax=Halobacillus sp. A5 TaxID=2880263 RepID=UPI0020A68F0B|nr:phosphate ABC transporter substrate-binding protein PstS family protein [Halobacillus sp. A5]MCP3025671.1 phosphate ABC transporter substrate-binding protein PstS family protein [Halobacillus sp. A5]
MKSFKRLALLFAFFLVVGVLAACGGSSEEGNSGSEDGGSEEGSGESGSITVGGSSAMQPLVAAAAEEFTAENSDAQIDVQGGGSGTGLSEVAAGNFDIGNSDYFAETKDDIDAEELVDHKVAVVGMTAAAHPEVGVDNLSKDELKEIFTGEITNWSEVGGADEEITLVNRPDGSGTRATFNEFGLDGEEPAEGITEDSSNRVMQIVNDTPGAVGYLSFAYFERNEDIVPLGVDGVEPTDENVKTGEFPIWAYQHSYTQGEPEGLEKEFLDYMMSEEIQTSLLPDQGYIPATEMEVERDAEGNESDIE